MLGVEGKLDYAINQYNEMIIKLADARIACAQANLTDRVIKIEAKIHKVNDEKNEFIKKKNELVAKVKELEAQRDAAIACAGIGNLLDSASPKQVVLEIDSYIKKLEAEIDTYNFMETL